MYFIQFSMTQDERKGLILCLKIEFSDGLGGVFLNVTSIGDNFTVLQNVTFGRRFAGDQIPTIGNNVTVCTNAVVCGGIMLHDGCTVGANSYVNQDVPANSLVAGSPAKVIKKGAEC